MGVDGEGPQFCRPLISGAAQPRVELVLDHTLDDQLGRRASPAPTAPRADSPRPPRPATGRSAPRSPPTAVPCVLRHTTSFIVLSGLEGAHAVPLTGRRFTAVGRRDGSLRCGLDSGASA